MTLDPLVLLPEVDRATERLLRTVAELSDTAVGEPSLLPGWTRGHVLTHLARNADSYVNLLTSARTGEDVPQYASPAARNDAIAAGAGRSVAVQLADLRASAERLAEAARELPAEGWAAQVRSVRGPRVAATLVWGRLREVEVHHVDLAVGYRTADWPDAFSQRVLHEVVRDLARRDTQFALVLRPAETGQSLFLGSAGQAGGDPSDSASDRERSGVADPADLRTVADAEPRTVAGPAHALAGWLTGRSAGKNLVVTPAGPLPAAPAWI
ncbi:maleylpyruvate isomerase family mycothiol-dependent enzyme [Plantactinospora sp. S1510]|uniref:Maleylpyruvate isomerase family mycothiol-dependent enzyme n=1 Tax=Plantactinospora alkalitolerans TaxID=2789879 RepID=A0ABS0H4X8_9ACTN|nr:maleylpyruvate isomerase family mycothiol-dependent enzyme [Plantactinospora alkalitolerans]MBF9133519.1 maleylpyruvate isomerase family mycothiol-dependent enzyme [Plantactinospora alkalitolerans]